MVEPADLGIDLNFGCAGARIADRAAIAAVLARDPDGARRRAPEFATWAVQLDHSADTRDVPALLTADRFAHLLPDSISRGAAAAIGSKVTSIAPDGFGRSCRP